MRPCGIASGLSVFVNVLDPVDGRGVMAYDDASRGARGAVPGRAAGIDKIVDGIAPNPRIGDFTQVRRLHSPS